MLSDRLLRLFKSETIPITAAVGESMADIQRIYARTIEGRRALRSKARLSDDHRKIIALLRKPTPLNHVGYLDELERAGLVDSIPVQWLVELYALGEYQPRRLSN